MKSAKKVRARTELAAKVRKKNAGTGKALVPKAKSNVKATASKTLSSKTPAKANSKAGKSGTTTKSLQKTKVSVKTNNAIKLKDKRKQRERSSAEFATLVTKTTKKTQTSPKKLMPVDRRNAKPAITARPSHEQVTEFDKNLKGFEELSVENKERRPKIPRRRQIDPTTCERDYSQEEIEFMNALDEYKRNSGRMFPTCSEILEVFRGLGYAKQPDEESVEISVNPESGNVDTIVVETSTLLWDDDQHDEEAQTDLLAGIATN